MRGATTALARLSRHGQVQAVVAVSAYAAGGAFLANLAMARTVGPSARGSLAFLLQVSYFVAPLVGMGADKVLLRRSGGENLPMERSTRHLLATAAVATAVAVAISGPLALALFPLAYGASWNAIRRAHALRYGTTRGYVAVAAAATTLVILGSTALYLLEVRSWLVWLVPYLVLPLVLMTLALVRNLRHGILGGIVSRQSLALVPGSLAALVVARSDRLILPIVAGPEALGVYIVVVMAAEPVAWLSQAVADRRVQHLGETHPRDYLRRLATREVPLLAALAAVTGTFLLLLLEPVFGPGYSSGEVLVVPVCLAVVVYAMYRLMMGLVLAGPRSVMYSTIEGGLALLAVPTYVVSIHVYGALGAAWGSVAVYCLGVAAAYLVCATDAGRTRSGHAAG